MRVRFAITNSAVASATKLLFPSFDRRRAEEEEERTLPTKSASSALPKLSPPLLLERESGVPSRPARRLSPPLTSRYIIPHSQLPHDNDDGAAQPLLPPPLRETIVQHGSLRGGRGCGTSEARLDPLLGLGGGAQNRSRRRTVE